MWEIFQKNSKGGRFVIQIQWGRRIAKHNKSTLEARGVLCGEKIRVYFEFSLWVHFIIIPSACIVIRDIKG